MEVILLRDVKKLGDQGKVVKVKDGYARNFLIPRGMAVMATAEELRTVQEIRRQQSAKLARAKAGAEDLKRRIEDFTAQFSLNAGEDGKPFGSVTVNDIAEKLDKEGLTVDKHAIQLDKPIKTLGKTTVAIRLHPEVKANLAVVVDKI
jgi:large subunit ribosomal protein L9